MSDDSCDYCHGIGACPRCWGRAAITKLEHRLAKAEELLGGRVLTNEEMDELAGYPLDHELMAKFTFKEGEGITPKTLHEALERYHQERKK
jgi:hypothetical protein